MSANEVRQPQTLSKGRTPESLEDPTQRCARFGAGVLSLKECVGVILNSKEGGPHKASANSKFMRAIADPYPEEDQARALFGTLEAAMMAPTPELSHLSGNSGARLLAAFELARRYHHFRTDSEGYGRQRAVLPELTRTALKRVDRHWRFLPTEWMGFIPVHKSRVGSLCLVERGTRTHVNVDPAELFARILVLRPTGFFLFHNHPSGDLAPSEPDFELTIRVDQISRQLGVKLYSHWIVSGPREAEVR